MPRIAFAFVAVLFAATAAQAEPGSTGQSTPEMKAARQSLRQACAEDVQTLCGGIEPGGGKILRCLKDHKDKVSRSCKDAAESLRAARNGGG